MKAKLLWLWEEWVAPLMVVSIIVIAFVLLIVSVAEVIKQIF